jgi:hypothetical protein
MTEAPISATDLLSEVPAERWPELMVARRHFVEVNFSHDCRYLLEFCNDCDVMYGARLPQCGKHDQGWARTSGA